MNNYLNGAFAGLVEVSITHPIDVFKTKIQNDVKKINIKKFSSFYSGFYPRLLGILPMRTVFWSSQIISYKFYNIHFDNFKYNSILAGATAGALQTIIDNPIEVLKIKQINNSHFNFNFNNLFIGFKPTLYRNTIFASCVGFGLFNNNIESNFKDNTINMIVYTSIGSLITQPIDYIKTIQQTNLNSNNSKNIYYILNNTNYKILFKGGLSRLIQCNLSMIIGSTIINLNLFD